jgi:high-affinity iron transporter
MDASTASPSPAGTRSRRRLALWGLALAAISGLVYLMATADTGPTDPTEAGRTMSHSTAVVNSAIIVFREGLEAVLIFAAVTASFLGANRSRRRPVVAGAAAAFGAAVLTWFVAQALLDVASPLGPRLEAITGFVAIVVLLIVLNWFVHKVYWTGWIAKHHRQRRRLLAASGLGATFGLVALGFTSVYREGFEVVLFLQALDLEAGTTTVLEGVAIGLAATAIVGVAVFKMQAKLPYRRMLVATGGLIGVVLVVMIGGTAMTFVDLGWLPDTPLGVEVPGWMGAWFEVYPYAATVIAQALAALFVIGSYLLAEHLMVRRPAKRGEPVAQRADAPPVAAPTRGAAPSRDPRAAPASA